MSPGQFRKCFAELNSKDRQTIVDTCVALRDQEAFCIVQYGAKVLAAHGGEYRVTPFHDLSGALTGFEVSTFNATYKGSL